MEIKPGKYVTRDKRQAVVLEVFEGKAFGRKRSSIEETNFWEEFSWYLDGSYYPDSAAISPADLIAPWEEPKPRLKAYRCELPGGYDHGTIKLLPISHGPPPPEWQPVPELDALFERSEG